MKMTVKDFNSLSKRDFDNGAIRDAFRKSLGERDSLIEMIHELFCQACYYEGTYDHQCLSTYEEAQDFLIKEGKIAPEQCYRVR